MVSETGTRFIALVNLTYLEQRAGMAVCALALVN